MKLTKQRLRELAGIDGQSNSETKGYQGNADSVEQIVELINQLPDSINNLTVPTSIDGKQTIKFVPKQNTNWKGDASDAIKNLAKKQSNNLKFKLLSHFGQGGKNEPYYIIVKK